MKYRIKVVNAGKPTQVSRAGQRSYILPTRERRSAASITERAFACLIYASPLKGASAVDTVPRRYAEKLEEVRERERV